MERYVKSRITVSCDQLTPCIPACGTAFILSIDNFGEVPVDKHSAVNIRFELVVTNQSIHQGAYDQYVAGADVLTKNASFMSGFVSYNLIVSQLTVTMS